MYTMLMFLQLAVLGFAFAALIEQITNILKNKEGACFALNIGVAAISVVYLIIAIVAISEPVMKSEVTNITFTPCIVALIIAVFNLCTSVARLLMQTKAKTEATQDSVAETNVDTTNA